MRQTQDLARSSVLLGMLTAIVLGLLLVSVVGCAGMFIAFVGGITHTVQNRHKTPMVRSGVLQFAVCSMGILVLMVSGLLFLQN